MALYAIGDIQGCDAELGTLLEALGFSPDRDRLWFVGDLVNRGPASLEALRRIRSLGEAALGVAHGGGVIAVDVAEVALAVDQRVALEEGLRAAISVRINPNVDPKTHPYISTGLKGNKFGVAHDRAVPIYQHAASLKGLEVVGIDCHIGSQITDVSPYLEALERVLDLVEAIEKSGIRLHHLDFGGGLGIDYNGDTPPGADTLWRQMLERLDAPGGLRPASRSGG